MTPSAFAHLLDDAAAAADLGADDGSSDDARHLAAAYREATKGVGRTSPNPAVGAVVVKDGAVVGVGFHAKAGERHAEIVALDAAVRAGGADVVRGSTVYVTLEPCVHHGRTPPCVDRLLKDGVARVVVGAVDPNPVVHERGIARLRSAGVAVDVAAGPIALRCAGLIAPFTKAVLEKRVYVVLKLATSLDGRIATANGASRWITGEPARALVHRLRDACDVVVVGAGTVLADDPALTVRAVAAGGRDPRDPQRVIVDGSGRVAKTAKAHAPPGALVYGRDLRAMFADLAARGFSSALVEAGPGLATALLQAGLVDELWWMTAPTVLGHDAIGAVGPLALGAPADAPRFHVLHRAAAGDDAVVVLRPSSDDADSR